MTVRVLCFAYGGGSSPAFRAWRGLWPDAEVVPVDYPGHLMRPSEPLARSMDELVERLYAELGELLDGDVLLCGSSMGAMVAFELARRCEHDGRRPRAVAVVGCDGPVGPPRFDPVGHLPDDEFLTLLAGRFGGPLADPAMAPGGELHELALPVLRADIGLVEAYRAGTDPEPIGSPLHVVSGRADTVAPPWSADRWRLLGTGPVRHDVVPGGHFLVETHPEPVVHALASAVAVPVGG